MSDVSNLSDTIVPKSDQLNAEQLLGGPITITVTGVKRGTDDQPIVIHYDGDNGRPYKPCKTCRKVLIFAWGDDGREWVGKSMTLFNNPEVKFGGVKVGGIRISHLSDIDRDLALSLTATKGKKEPFLIRPLPKQQPAAAPAKAASGTVEDEVKAAKRHLMAVAGNGTAALQAAWTALPADMRTAISADGKCPDRLKQVAAEAGAANAAKPAAPEPTPATPSNDEDEYF